MKKYKFLLAFHRSTYMQMNKSLIPITVWIFGLFFTYEEKPVGITSSYAVTTLLLFVIISWISYGYLNSFDEELEKIVILEVGERTFYHSVVVFLLMIGSVLALSAVAIPLIFYAMNGSTFYNRTLGWSDVVQGLAIHLICLPLGIIGGLFMQRRIVRDRKTGLMLTILLTILSICSGFVGALNPIEFIVPPISPIIKIAASENRFNWIEMVRSLGISAVYFSAVYNTYLFLLKKKGF